MKLLPLLVLLPLAAGAQTVYRCPGPPETFTNLISADEAKRQGCRSIEGAPISVVQTPRRAGPAPGAAPGTAAQPQGNSVRLDGPRVDPTLQRQRDNDRRLVLESELRGAEAKLAELKREYADGQPERRGDERNFAKYQERVAEMKAAIQRQESDIAALRRELEKTN